MKIDKSLEEVWDWKDKVYESTKNLSIKEAAKRIHNEVEQIRKKYNIKLKKVSLT